MKKVAAMFALVLVMGMVAAPVFAQEAAGGGAPHSATYVVVASTLSMALAAGLCGIGQGKIGGAACEGIARNPGAGGPIRLAMILGLVFIETLALFTFAIVAWKG